MKITMQDLNELILICCAELNNLSSHIMDNKIQEDLHVFVKNKKTYYQFSNFKERVEDYKFALEEFNKNKRWNLEHEVTKTCLYHVNEVREFAETSLNNINRILKKTNYIEFRDNLKDSVNTLIDAINGYLLIIKQFFETECSELEYKNIMKNYNLQNLDKIK